MLSWLLRIAVNTLIFAGLGLAAFGFAGSLRGLSNPQPAQQVEIVPPEVGRQPVVEQLPPALSVSEADLNLSDADATGMQAPTIEPLSAGETVPAGEVLEPADNVGQAQIDQDMTVAEQLSFRPSPPEWLSIPRIALETQVVLAPAESVEVDGEQYRQWDAPEYFAAGWHEGSAMPGFPGNTVLNGHHNISGKVFADLHQLQPGDTLTVTAGGRPFTYVVTQVMIFEERGQSMEQRQENAHWLLPSVDERLTLVTCWPPERNTHRLIVVAQPLQ